MKSHGRFSGVGRARLDPSELPDFSKTSTLRTRRFLAFLFGAILGELVPQAADRIAVAAQRTTDGYTVEAAVPWSDLFTAPGGHVMAIALKNETVQYNDDIWATQVYLREKMDFYHDNYRKFKTEFRLFIGKDLENHFSLKEVSSLQETA